MFGIRQHSVPYNYSNEYKKEVILEEKPLKLINEIKDKNIHTESQEQNDYYKFVIFNSTKTLK